MSLSFTVLQTLIPITDRMSHKCNSTQYKTINRQTTISYLLKNHSAKNFSKLLGFRLEYRANYHNNFKAVNMLRNSYKHRPIAS